MYKHMEIVKQTPDEEEFLWDYFDNRPFYIDWYYALYRGVRDARFHIKSFFQRLFNKGIAKCDLWSLNHTLIEFIYPRILKFRQMDRQGYPCMFHECEEHEDKERYAKGIEDGTIIGGGQDKWNEILDEIIFGLEYFLFAEHACETPDSIKFWKKYYNEFPWEEKESNKCFSYYYYCLEDRPDLSRWMSTSELITDENARKEKYELRRIGTFYRNWELERKAGERAQAAFVLLGRYFQNLWD